VALLATLPPHQQAVLVLRCYEDLFEADITDILGCSRASEKPGRQGPGPTMRGI
jgi:DNA-directed RNA polymerase specialized sigma24 family protein